MKNVKAIAIALAAVFTLSIAGNSQAFSLKKTFKGVKKGISKTVKKSKRTISKTAKVVRKQTKKTAKVVYKQTKKTVKVVHKQTRKVTNPIKRTVRKTGQTLRHGIRKSGKVIGHTARKTGRVIGHAARKTGKAINKGANATKKWSKQAYKDVKRTANKVCRESNRALETTYNGAKRGTKRHVGKGWARNTAEFGTDVTFDYGVDRLVGGACATQRIVLNPVKSFNKTKGSVNKLGKGLSRFSKDPVRHTGKWGKGAIHTLAQAPKNIASGNSSSERGQVSTARNMIDPLSYMDPGE